MGESDELPDVLDDLVATLLRQGFAVTANCAGEFVGDRVIEFTHGHRGVLLTRDRGRWTVDVRLIDRWFAPASVESILGAATRPAQPARPGRPGLPALPSLDEQALSTLTVIDAMPPNAAALRDLRDQVALALQRRRAPFLGRWNRREPRR
jgi:hypothetical protein